MTTRCLSCSRPCSGVSLCGSCEHDLEKALGQIPALEAELELTVTRQTAMGSRNGSRSTSKPLPVNLDASQVADDLKATLIGWVRDLEPDVQFQPRNTLTGISRWLMMRLPAIRVHIAADEICDEIQFATKAAWRAIDRPANRSRVYVSGCLDVSCDGEWWARFPVEEYDPDDDNTHAKITCTECSTSYPASSWLHIGKRILHMTEDVA